MFKHSIWILVKAKIWKIFNYDTLQKFNKLRNFCQLKKTKKLLFELKVFLKNIFTNICSTSYGTDKDKMFSFFFFIDSSGLNIKLFSEHC